uniref:Protein kinase domain-containing protein n=1 Tax=Rhabditophanes sp. KR3021 TaxID=114890 RepID=A0AC35TLW9_9BILA
MTSRPSVTSPSPTVLGPNSALERHYHSLQYTTIVGGHWGKYDALSCIGGKDVSILVFERKNNIKAPSRFGRIANSLTLTEILKYEVTTLSNLAHPRMVRVLHSLEDTKEMLAFAVEPIYMSLDMLMIEKGVERLEMKLGVLQLIDGITYLHNKVHLLHSNLVPSSIYISKNKQWKIAGFGFSVRANDSNLFPCYTWSKKVSPELQPDLDFLAPEYFSNTNNFVTNLADVWSFGCLVCWIYTGGKRLIDAKHNLDTYHVIVDQLDVALNAIACDLGDQLKKTLESVLSTNAEQRPSIKILSLAKHFEDPAVSVLKQLDDISQVFDPTQKSIFLGQTLKEVLPTIPEPLWFTRVLPRLDQSLKDCPEFHPPIFNSLLVMLDKCESHNIHKLNSWFHIIFENWQMNGIMFAVLENMHIILRRLNDAVIEDKCLEILQNMLMSKDHSARNQAVKTCLKTTDLLPLPFIQEVIFPVFQTYADYLVDNASRQMELIEVLELLSDRCDTETLEKLIITTSEANLLHPGVVHAKSKLVQRILIYDAARLRNCTVIAHHLLNPLTLGLANLDLIPAHFDAVMSSTRFLLDVIEQIRCDMDDYKIKTAQKGFSGNRRVSMSSNHLPRLMITAANNSYNPDNRKTSFLSADGRLEDPNFRRNSKDSRSSMDSEFSFKLSKASDASDESCKPTSESRRKSWLGQFSSVSFDQQGTPSNGTNASPTRSNSSRQSVRAKPSLRPRSPAVFGDNYDGTSSKRKESAKPNSLSNLGHNLACTIWKTFQQ